MIDFRYYLVAITSIFAALIAGLVIGSSLSTSEVAKKQQEALVESIKKDISMLRKELVEKSNELENLKNYHLEARKWIIYDKLYGKTVYLVYSDDVSEKDTLNSLKEDLELAGANIVQAKIVKQTTETTLLSDFIRAAFQPEAPERLSGDPFAGKVDLIGNAVQAQEVVLVVSPVILKMMEEDEGIKSVPPLRGVSSEIESGRRFLSLAPEKSSVVIYDGDIYDSEAFILSFSSDGGIFGERGIGMKILPELKIQ